MYVSNNFFIAYIFNASYGESWQILEKEKVKMA